MASSDAGTSQAKPANFEHKKAIAPVRHKSAGQRNSPSLSATPNLRALLLALQRRWMTATFLGLLCAGIAAAVAWRFAPTAKYDAQAMVEVSSKPNGVLPGAEKQNVKNFISFQKTQLVRVKSQLVLNKALKDPNVAQLSIVREKINPVEWLTQELEVDFSKGPEILSIKLSGDKPEELKIIVDAVVANYLDQFINRDRRELQARIDRLNELKGRHKVELNIAKKQMEDFDKGATGEGLPVWLEQNGTLLGEAKSKLLETKRAIRKLQQDLKRFNEDKAALPTKEIPSVDVERLINQDPQIPIYQGEIARLEQEHALMKRVLGDGAILQKKKSELDTAKATLEKHREAITPKIMKRLREGATSANEALIEAAERELKLNQDDEQMWNDQIKHLTDKASEAGEVNFEASLVELAVTQEREIIKLIDQNIRVLNDNIGAKPRAETLDKAIVTETGNGLKKIGLVGGSGMVAFALALLGVSYGEFRSRRISSAEEVVQGLGIQLVGALPSISQHVRGRMKGDGNSKYAGGQQKLIEAVDSYRTLLLHSTRVSAVRVVMVTSAMAGEGKTTLASHLAVSLARTGRKTLLIDTDMRNPMAHRLFSLPLGPGLSEVLRNEVGPEEVVQDTPVPTLSMVTAGEADHQAFETLAHDNLTKLFDHYKQRFDFIIVDSCPVLPVADSLLVGQHADGVLFSLLRNVSRMPKVYAAYQRLSMLGIQMIGAVITGTDEDPYSYGYSSQSSSV